MKQLFLSNTTKTSKIPQKGIMGDLHILNKKENAKINFNDFISSILKELNTKNEKIINSQKKVNSLKTIEKKISLKQPVSSNNSKDTLLNELLSLVVFLKSNGFSGKFPTDTKKLSHILSNKQALSELKNIKDVKDILKVAKKYNIDIKKFEFTKEETKAIETKITEIKTKKTIISSERMFKDIKTKTTGKHIIKKSLVSPLNNLMKKENTKNNQTENLSKYKNPSYKQNTKNIHNTQISSSLDKPVLSHNTKQKNSNNLSKDQQTKQFTDKIKFLSLDKPILSHNKPTRSDDVKIVSQMKIFEDHKKIKNNTKHNMLDKDNISSLSQADKSSTAKIKEKQIKTINYEPIENKQVNMHIKNEILPQHLKGNNTQTNQTTTQFANDLKEQIQHYKPPIMKIKMTLNPKHLGEVEVSMLNRGNTLQITINSSTSTMAVFVQNQAEFKNSLVNMGFTNLNMNFNSNGDNQNKNSNHSQKNSKNFKNFSETEIENINTLDITIPRYI